MKIKVSLTVTQPPDIGKNKWRQCTKAGHHRQALIWQKDYLPRHFTPEAKTRYGHQKRKAKYLKNKERGGYRKVNGKRIFIQLGGKVDNVYSGEMLQMLKSSGTIQAFPSRSILKMTGPRYVTMRPYKSSQPAKGKEITTITKDEQDALTEVLRFETMRQYMAWKQPKTVTI